MDQQLINSSRVNSKYGTVVRRGHRVSHASSYSGGAPTEREKEGEEKREREGGGEEEREHAAAGSSHEKNKLRNLRVARFARRLARNVLLESVGLGPRRSREYTAVKISRSLDITLAKTADASNTR